MASPQDSCPFYMGVSQNFGGPYKDYSILGSILGSPYFWKLPYFVTAEMVSCRVTRIEDLLLDSGESGGAGSGSGYASLYIPKVVKVWK